MMWLLAEIYQSSPEVGDVEQPPELVFFLAEAFLLFDDASKTLRDSVEMTIRMIRSKGAGVFSVTQQPRVPDDVLAQLGSRVQHALRAFTPQEGKALRATAGTFPVSEHHSVEAALRGLGTKEALVTVLDPDGRPTPTVPTRPVAPVSQKDLADGGVVRQILSESTSFANYAESLERDSAAEVLAQRAEARALAAELHAQDAHAQEALDVRERELAKCEAQLEAERSGTRHTPSRARSRSNATERLINNAASSVGRELGRSLLRGLLGNLGR